MLSCVGFDMKEPMDTYLTSPPPEDLGRRKPPVKTFPQLSQNRNRKLEKDFSRLRTQWRIFLSISRTSSRAPVLT
jgi:hypothetical protein